MPSKGTWTAAAGAVVGAVLASLCCVSPLIVAALGIGSAGFATTFAPYRPYLLALTGLLLAGAFYLTHRRRSAACGPDGACRSSKLPRRQDLLLWVVTIVVAAMSTSPYWGGWVGDGTRGAAAARHVEKPSAVVDLAVTGMTCDACAAHVQSALAKVHGVGNAEVSYAGGQARVALVQEVSPQDLISAIEATGYAASVIAEPRP